MLPIYFYSIVAVAAFVGISLLLAALWRVVVSPEVVHVVQRKKNTVVYFAATGGAAALIARSVTSAEVVAYEDLGAEAIRKLTTAFCRQIVMSAPFIYLVVRLVEEKSIF